MTKIKLAKAVFWFINFLINFLIVALVVWGIVSIFLLAPLITTAVFSTFIILILYIWAVIVIDEEKTKK